MDIFSDERWPAIDLLAESIGVESDARRKWRERGRVPSKWHLLLLRAARKRRVRLSDDDLLSTTSLSTGASS